MEFNMDEVKSVITNTITELNNQDEAHKNEVHALNDQIAELNAQIEAKDALIEEKDAVISELNASAAQIQELLDQMKSDQETWWKERDILETELAKAKVAEKLAELDDALGEFNEEEKSVAKEEIDQLKENVNACKRRDELNDVSSEINSIFPIPFNSKLFKYFTIHGKKIINTNTIVVASIFIFLKNV